MINRLIENMPDGLAPALAVAEDESEAPESSERYLVANFIRLVSELQFADLVHLVDANKTLKTVDSYKLDSLMSSRKIVETLDECGDFWRWPNGVNRRHRVPFPFAKTPFLDTSLAIGLVYKNRLNAVAAAGADATSSQQELIIKQIQGTIKIQSRQDYRESGLHTSIRWEDTLVQAWIELAKSSGIGTVAIQAATNADWRYQRAVEERGKGQLERNYDLVAERMGFTQNPESLNWELQV